MEQTKTMFDEFAAIFKAIDDQKKAEAQKAAESREGK